MTSDNDCGDDDDDDDTNGAEYNDGSDYSDSVVNIINKKRSGLKVPIGINPKFTFSLSQIIRKPRVSFLAWSVRH